MRIILACLLLLTLPLPASPQPASGLESLMTMCVDGHISIDSEGRVMDYRIDTELPPEIRQVIDKAVPHWAFWPVMVDGKVVAAKTKMRLTLAAREHGTGYEVSIDNAVFGNEDKESAKADLAGSHESVTISSAKRKPLPKYPGNYNVNGLVLVYIQASLSGKIEQAVAVQSTLFNAEGEPEELSAALEAMENSAVKAIRQWTVKVDAHGVEPTPGQLTAAISVRYVMPSYKPVMITGSQKMGRAIQDWEATGRWRKEARSQRHPAPWLSDFRTAQRVGVSDIDATGLVQLDSQIRLHDGMIPQTL